MLLSIRKISLPAALTWMLVTLGNSSIVAGEEKPGGAKPETEQKGSSVDGSVLMPDGSPAVGADVHLLHRGEGAYILPVKTTKVVTDKEGRFHFSTVKPGKYKVWAETPQLTSLKKKLGGYAFTIGDDGGDLNIDPLKLHKGCNYRVKIVSAATGKPLPGGRVWFGWTDLPREYHGDDGGIVEIGGLAVDDWYFVVAAEGHGIKFKKIPKQSLGSTTELVFKLNVGGDLVGVAQTDQGEPVEGVVIYASSTEGGMTPHYGRETTDEQGRFVFKNLPAGVSVRIGGRKAEYNRVSTNVVIPVGKKQVKTNLIFNPLPYGGDCIVTVVDEQGQPIAGAALRNDGNSTSLHRDATTDKNGQGRLANMYSSYRGHRVFVRAKGFITQELDVKPGTAKEPSEVRVTMQQGKTLRGRVVDPDGKPAANIRVYYNQGEHPWTLGGRVETDADGKFEIDGLPEQSTLTVYTPRQFAPIKDMPVTAGLDELLTVKMELSAVIRIRAIDEQTGKPIPEFNVKVENTRDRREGDPWGSFSTEYTEQGVNVMGETKKFEMTNLVAGTPLKVTVSAKDYLPLVQDRVLAVRSDQAPLIDIALKRDSPDNYEPVAGTLKRKDGKPVVGAIVKLVVGKVNPVSEAARARGSAPDQWRNYRWLSVESGDIARSEHCLQFLSTSTNEKGEFKFDRVRKSGSWIELFHTGGEVATARFPDLRGTYPESLVDLRLTAVGPSSIKLFVDRDKWPDAHAVRLSAPYAGQYPDCLKLPFNNKTVEIDPKTNEVKFDGLPSGDFRIRVEAKPIPVGGGGIRTETLGSYFIQLPAGEDMQGDL